MGMLLFDKVIKKWKKEVKKYFLSYKNGFFEIFQYANSPQLMIRNFINMPFVKSDEIYQTIAAENPFLKVKIFYLSFEKGLLLMLTKAFYKKNVMDRMLYDEELPTEYFFIALKVHGKCLESRQPLINGTNHIHNFWSLCKPAGIKNISHFKNSDEQFYTLFFTKIWLDNYLIHADEIVKTFFTDFLNSDATYIMWPSYETLGKSDYSLFKDVLENSKPVSEINQELFRDQSLMMFNDFASDISNFDFHANYLKISNEQRLKILRAEDYMRNFYNDEFPGIAQIAEKVGISHTGLKTGFNQLFGCSIYKYFRNQKMKIALSILEQNSDIKIKDLATQLGYDNAAKFTAAFKEEIGFLPSKTSIIQ